MKLSFPRKRVVLSLSIAFLIFLVVLGQFFFSRAVTAEREMIEDLRTRRMLLELDIQNKTRLLKAYKETIGVIGDYRISLPIDEVAFFSSVERELARNGIQVNSMKPSKPVSGSSAVQIEFIGPYYSVLNVMADWRGMGAAVRMVSVSLSKDEAGMVKGTAVLETVLPEGGV
ncbi:MAG: hypothetical protein RQ767_07935 [Thermovirgaceae bacterium]|nr:hypothetical protein [Thermovirgaceae bacterium]